MGDIEKIKEESNVDVEAGNKTEGGDVPTVITAASLSDPKFLEALKSRLNANCLIVIPKHLKRKVKALKKLQYDHTNLEAEFYLELHNLEMKYEKLYAPFYEKRRKFVLGEVEPTDEECNFTLDDDDEEDEEEEENKITEGVKDMKVDENSQEKTEEVSDVKGIPEFWLTAFKNAPALAETIEEHDEPILKHLIDVKATTEFKPMGFYLEFHFEPNPYFNNTVLTKYYEMKCTPDPTDPFTFDGPEIIKCKGCSIEWKKGMNVTLKTIKKKQKHKARGATRVVVKTVQNDSFFNFFNPPTAPDDEEEMDEATNLTLSSDYEIGNTIKDRIIPQAVLYYTGENAVDDEFDEDEDEEDEDLEEEDEESDDENGGHLVKKTKDLSQTKPPECNHQ